MSHVYTLSIPLFFKFQSSPIRQPGTDHVHVFRCTYLLCICSRYAGTPHIPVCNTCARHSALHAACGWCSLFCKHSRYPAVIWSISIRYHTIYVYPIHNTREHCTLHMLHLVAYFAARMFTCSLRFCPVRWFRAVSACRVPRSIDCKLVREVGESRDDGGCCCGVIE